MNTFFDINLNHEQTISLFNESKEVCEHWWFDILDCTKSIQRQRVDISFENALKYYTDKDIPSLILRRFDFNEYFEVGFHTLGDPGYFLWIIVSLKKMKSLIKKYKLRAILGNYDWETESRK